MIARLEVTRGTLTEYPLAERVRDGWQNGVTFYPDAEVTNVTPLHVTAAEPQGEPSDAQIEAALSTWRDFQGDFIEQSSRSWQRDRMRAALRAAGAAQ